MEKTNHHVIIYGILVLIVLCMVFLAQRSLKKDAGGEWLCSSYSCVKEVSSDAWIAQNCFVDASTGNQSCRLFINGIEQLVPLDAINTTYLSQQCEEYVCTQETLTRSSNYSIVIDTASLQVN